MNLPRHPAGEKKATWFHLYAGAICLLHLPVVVLGTWYHLTGARRHWRARER